VRVTRPMSPQCGLVFERLLKLGGLEAMAERNQQKAAKIYGAIAASNGFYTCPVAPAVRSLMNIPFTMATPELEKAFLKICEQRGLVQLKGHRSVGGIRASVYNAMPTEGVDALVAVMKVRRCQRVVLHALYSQSCRSSMPQMHKATHDENRKNRSMETLI